MFNVYCSHGCQRLQIALVSFLCVCSCLCVSLRTILQIESVSFSPFMCNPPLLYWSPVCTVLTCGGWEAFQNLMIKSQCFSWLIFLTITSVSQLFLPPSVVIHEGQRGLESKEYLSPRWDKSLVVFSPGFWAFVTEGSEHILKGLLFPSLCHSHKRLSLSLSS